MTTTPYLSKWEDYGLHDSRWACVKDHEFCGTCGREMVESIEPTGMRSTKTGAPTFTRWHSCPTWVQGWRTKAPGIFLPGYGHDSHDADNPLSGRTYR